MLMLTRRLQILVDDERLHRLEREAARRKVPVSVLVRDAIDAMYPVDTPARRAAAERILAAEPMPVPDPASLRRELDDLRSRRG
ncbi:MAG: ribbon-helix-helix protein, CopG family [Acidimicrobiales bacterium]